MEIFDFDCALPGIINFKAFKIIEFINIKLNINLLDINEYSKIKDVNKQFLNSYIVFELIKYLQY